MKPTVSSPVIYLDHAAATPLDSRVAASMQKYSDQFHNPSAVYLAGIEARNALREARELVAHWLGAKSSEIVFTSGATEANNMAIQGVLSQHPGAQAVVSTVEHDSVRAAANCWPETSFAGVHTNGRIAIDELRAKITDTTALISIILANNEVGTVQSMSEIMQLVEQIRNARKAAGNDMPLIVHTDASQAANYLDLHVNRLGVDLMTLNGGKMYGPKKTGALYIRTGVQLQPLLLGGGQERNLRSGTESLADAWGFATALDIAQKSRADEVRRLQLLKKQFVKAVKVLHADVEVHGHAKHALPNIISFSIEGLDGERAVMMLDERGIQCATGSACGAQKDEASHVIQALGYSQATAAGTLRLSMGRSTTEEDVAKVIAALNDTLGSPNVWLV